MRVFALVGPSGTGKSHRAVKLAHELGCQIIVDDGLVIEQNRILVGISAKKQPTRLGAIKTAVFTDPQHRAEACKAIHDLQPAGVLIMGTSNSMVLKIVEMLNLPSIEKIISIYDVASIKEIRKARYLRTQQARHVIPAPAVEVRKSMGHALIDPIKVFFSRKETGRQTWAEQSVVRPTFTSLGSLSISEAAIQNAIKYQLEQTEGVVASGHLKLEHLGGGLQVTAGFIGRYGDPLHKIAYRVQSSLMNLLENLTVPVNKVNIIVESVAKSGSRH